MFFLKLVLVTELLQLFLEGLTFKLGLLEIFGHLDQLGTDDLQVFLKSFSELELAENGVGLDGSGHF